MGISVNTSNLSYSEFLETFKEEKSLCVKDNELRIGKTTSMLLPSLRDVLQNTTTATEIEGNQEIASTRKRKRVEGNQNHKSLKINRQSSPRQSSSRPQSLQYALPGVSSSETMVLLGELANLKHELSWINHTATIPSPVYPVFGWRNAMWTLKSPDNNDMVVWKSAKAFESIPMRVMGVSMWQSDTSYTSELSQLEHVYFISNEARIVRCSDTLYGRPEQSSLWLECLVDRGDAMCIMRKQLHGFADSVTKLSDRECHGILLRPLVLPVHGQLVFGTIVHTLRSIATRGRTSGSQQKEMIDNLPRFTLQWEETFVHNI